LLVSIPASYSQETFRRHAALLGDPRMSLPANARQRAKMVRQIQRDYGNYYVQRLAEHSRITKESTPVQRDWVGLQLQTEEPRANATSDSAESTGLTQAEREEDTAVSSTILGLLNDFENIEVSWSEERPEGFIGPLRGFLVKVQAVYFIATNEGEADVKNERQRVSFGRIVKALNEETSVMVSDGGGSRSAGQTVQYGKATPVDVKKFVEKAIELGIITRYSRKKGKLTRDQKLIDLPDVQIQEIIQKWINETRVGVDCSGLVAQAALRAEQTRGALLGPPKSPLPSTARIRNAQSFANGPRVNQPTDLRPGQAWVVKGGGHIRMVAEVDARESHVEFVTVESAGDSQGGPGPTRRKWRTKNLEQFHRITLIEGPTGNPRGGTFHEIP